MVLRLAVSTDREVYAPKDTIAVVLTLRNEEAVAARLNFATTQRYDVEVRDGRDNVVERWSDGRMFGQMLEEKPIASGKSLVFRERIPAPSRPGEYEVVCWVPAMAQAFEGRSRIRVRR